MSDRRARAYAAVDLGASGGRVLLGVLTADAVQIEEIHRFPNRAMECDGASVWDLEELFRQTLVGLSAVVLRCREQGIHFAGIGADSWGVDWAYLRSNGTVELPARTYRGAPDPTRSVMARPLPAAEVYRLSGVADHAINTALRMAADARARSFAGETPLFIPDVWTYWLAGTVGTDPTIASTSQLLDVRNRRFSPDLIAANGLDGLHLPAVQPTGSFAGLTTTDITERIGADEPIRVFRVAGHDTACAFAFADPVSEARVALISSGTWSLVGSVQALPCTTEAARLVGFTNELGVAGVLVLRNLTGLWMLQECGREWQDPAGPTLDDLLRAAESLPFDDHTFDVSDPRLFRAGDMERRIRELCAEVGRPLESHPLSIVHAALDSLAAGYAASVRETQHVTGAVFEQIRIVGGGSRNASLCRRTAQLTGLPTVAGPVEATAIGNLAVQAHTDGSVSELREFYRMLGPGNWHTFWPEKTTRTTWTS